LGATGTHHGHAPFLAVDDDRRDAALAQRSRRDVVTIERGTLADRHRPLAELITDRYQCDAAVGFVTEQCGVPYA
jgi:hypothetical protein